MTTPRSAENSFRLIGGVGERAHGADQGRDLAPAGERLSRVAAVLVRVPIALWRAR